MSLCYDKSCMLLIKEMKYLVAILKTSVAQTAGMRKKPISSLSSSISEHVDISAQSCTK